MQKLLQKSIGSTSTTCSLHSTKFHYNSDNVDYMNVNFIDTSETSSQGQHAALNQRRLQNHEKVQQQFSQRQKSQERQENQTRQQNLREPYIHEKSHSQQIQEQPYVHEKSRSQQIQQQPYMHEKSHKQQIQQQSYIHENSQSQQIQEQPYIHEKSRSQQIQQQPYIHEKSHSQKIQEQPYVHEKSRSPQIQQQPYIHEKSHSQKIQEQPYVHEKSHSQQIQEQPYIYEKSHKQQIQQQPYIHEKSHKQQSYIHENSQSQQIQQQPYIHEKSHKQQSYIHENSQSQQIQEQPYIHEKSHKQQIQQQPYIHEKSHKQQSYIHENSQSQQIQQQPYIHEKSHKQQSYIHENSQSQQIQEQPYIHEKSHKQQIQQQPYIHEKSHKQQSYIHETSQSQQIQEQPYIHEKSHKQQIQQQPYIHEKSHKQQSYIHENSQSQQIHEQPYIYQEKSHSGSRKKPGLLNMASLLPSTNSNEIEDPNAPKFLKEMGFATNKVKNWNQITQPIKTNLSDLLRYFIENFIKPNVQIRIGTIHFNCHMMVLQCYSDFFMTFTSEFVIYLPEEALTPAAFMMAYEWMLCDRPIVQREGIVELLKAAKFLRMRELVTQCWEFLDDERVRENVAYFLYVEARHYGDLESLEQLMISRISKFFLTLVASYDFLCLDIEDIVSLLSSNMIAVTSESEVFMSAVRWLNHNWSTRNIYVKEVMSTIRFPLMPPFLLMTLTKKTDCKQIDRILEHDAVRKMVLDGMTLNTLRRYYRNNCDQLTAFLKRHNLIMPMERQWVYETIGNIPCNDHLITYHSFLEKLQIIQALGINYFRSLEFCNPFEERSARSEVKKKRKYYRYDD